MKRAQSSSPDDPLYVVAVGAITNVSNAILIEPSIIRNIVVVWLGGNGHHWPHQREFNFRQDLNASRVIFDSGVPFVQLPCTPVVTHFATTVPEMERYVGGRGAIGDYLLDIFKDYQERSFRVVQGLMGHDGRCLGDQRRVAPLGTCAQSDRDGQLHLQLRPIAAPDPGGDVRSTGSDLSGLLYET